MRERIVSFRRRVAAFLRRLAVRIDVPDVPVAAARFHVSRVQDGYRETVYRGDNGGDARRAWEALLANKTLKGKLRFYDNGACRGQLER